jgi:phosphoenolpyruvate carboxylase
MAKADPRVTAMYDAKLVSPQLQALGDELRGKFAATKAQVRARAWGGGARAHVCAGCTALCSRLGALLGLQSAQSNTHKHTRKHTHTQTHTHTHTNARHATPPRAASPQHQQVLALVRQTELLEDPENGASPELDEKLRLRAPYVTPLNILQVRPRRRGGRACRGVCCAAAATRATRAACVAPTMQRAVMC